MNKFLGAMSLGMVVAVNGCSGKPAPAQVPPAPVVSKSKEVIEEKPEEKEPHPAATNKDYLLVPTTPVEFEENFALCIAQVRASEVIQKTILPGSGKSCRTVQRMYTLGEDMLAACAPVANADAFLYAQIDKDILMRVLMMKKQLRVWERDLEEVVELYPKCFRDEQKKRSPQEPPRFLPMPMPQPATEPVMPLEARNDVIR